MVPTTKESVAQHSGLAACALFLVAFVFGLLLGFLIDTKTMRANHDITPPKPNAENICSSPSCAMVVALLTQSADLEVEPCKHFRRHVCGRWNSTSVLSDGYAGENRVAFHARIGLNLKRLANSSQLSGSAIYQMARFYSSCQVYARRQRQTSVEDILEISGIRALAWSKAHTFEELLVVIVAEVLHSGLSSVISVKWSDPRVHVDVGTSLSNTMRGLPQHLSAFVKDVLLALGLQEDATLLSDAIRLDSEVGRTLSAPSSEFFAITVCQLPPVGYCEHWLRGLNLGLDNRKTISKRSLVLVRDILKLKTLISSLGSANLTLASIYTLLIPLSQVMKYAYALTPNKAGSESQEGDFCLWEMAERFPTLFPVWVAETVETAESRGYFEEMVIALGQATAGLHQVAHGVVLNITDIAKTRMKVDCKFTSLTFCFCNAVLACTSHLNGKVYA
ncbi:hypothetical protein HPB48_006953 [Haemaphysalis longicornis]|uniref:Peptidase M13 N-terminal domain-containing protein n=1 Tax=Haemaphysalis longicornis TaxID=44386 RepID=A0A9J6GPQ6_HAELO|nr:hypothetical protein HPB48_006953 [Haemaphysalis longicornis]